MAGGAMSDGVKERPAPRAIRVLGFGASVQVPLWMAEEDGHFADEGLAVAFERTQSSAAQFRTLAEGRCDVVATAFDNVVAHREGQADLDGPLDVIALMALNRGLNSLVAAPGIERIDELRRGRLAVDSAASGYAILLYDLLRRNGVDPAECSVLPVGSSGERLRALLDGRVAAAIIARPKDLEAEASGCRILCDATDGLDDYQGSVLAALRPWAEGHREELVGFLSAFRRAVGSIMTERARAIAVIAAREGGDPGSAARVYDSLVDRRAGLSADGAIRVAGARTVLELRARHTGAALAEPAAYCDDSYRKEAGLRRGSS